MKYLISLLLTFGFLWTEPLLFSDFLEFFIEGNKKISTEYRQKFINIPINCQGGKCPDFIAKKFLYERPDKIMLVYEMECSAGGICDIQNIVIYNQDEKIAGLYPYFVHTADCSFNKKQSATFISDSLLFILTVETHIECETEQSESKEISLTSVDLTSQPFKEFTEIIDERRTYWLSSTQILDNQYLNTLSQDSIDFIRNEIFASKGYAFKKKKWRDLFEQTDWYIARENAEIQLSVIEQINVDKLLELKNN